jgi:hypothetical protein
MPPKNNIFSATFADVTAHAVAVHIRPTYSGVIVGRPNPELDEHLIRLIPELVRQTFGTWPLLMIRAMGGPSDRQADRSEVHLPDVEFWARFEALEVRHRQMHGSCLLLVWHQTTMFPFIAPEVVSRIRQIKWLDSAQDFEH